MRHLEDLTSAQKRYRSLNTCPNPNREVSNIAARRGGMASGRYPQRDSRREINTQRNVFIFIVNLKEFHYPESYPFVLYPIGIEFGSKTELQYFYYYYVSFNLLINTKEESIVTISMHASKVKC